MVSSGPNPNHRTETRDIAIILGQGRGRPGHCSQASLFLLALPTAPPSLAQTVAFTRVDLAPPSPQINPTLTQTYTAHSASQNT